MLLPPALRIPSLFFPHVPRPHSAPLLSCRVNFPEQSDFTGQVDELDVLPMVAAADGPSGTHSAGPQGFWSAAGMPGSTGGGSTGGGSSAAVAAPVPPPVSHFKGVRGSALPEIPLAVGQAVQVRRTVTEPAYVLCAAAGPLGVTWTEGR